MYLATIGSGKTVIDLEEKIVGGAKSSVGEKTVVGESSAGGGRSSAVGGTLATPESAWAGIWRE